MSLQVYRMARALVDGGHEVVLLAPSADAAAATPPLGPSGAVQGVAADGGVAALEGFPAAQMRYAMAAFETLARLQRQRPFDYVQFPDTGGAGYFALRAKKWAGQFRDTLLGVGLHLPDRVRRELNREDWYDLATACTDHLEAESLRLADLVIAPSHSMLERVPLPAGVSHCIIPPPILAPAEAAEEGPPHSPGWEILFVGPLEWRSGVQQLVRVTQRLLDSGMNLGLRLIGQDTQTGSFGRSMRTLLEAQIAPQHRGRISFEPALTGGQLQAALRRADLVCLPSRWEGFPDLCLEAMAEGKAVVAAREGAVQELFEDGVQGVFFPAGDDAALEAGLKRALADPELRRAVGEAARQRVRVHCDPKTFVRRLLEGTRPPQPPHPAPRPRVATPTPAVSVIIPYFNLGRYLPETLHSLRQQTFRSFEIILVDDGSTDPQSVELLDRLADEGGLRIIRKPNGGLGSARNAGLKAARGQWILPLDADDLLAPTFLQDTVAVLEEAPDLAYVTSLASRFVENPEQPIGIFVPWGLEPEILPVTNVASTCTALMPLRILHDLGGYDEELTSFEDWDLYLRMAERALRGAVLPSILFHYRLRPDSLVGTEVLKRRRRLSSRLIATHPSLVTERTLRLQVAECPATEEVALRYRLVERVNQTLKAVPTLHRGLKSLTQWLLHRG